MNPEYKIEITMTPHSWDNPCNPYFWMILQYNNPQWTNTGCCGWSETPITAWETALKEYHLYINGQLCSIR